MSQRPPRIVRLTTGLHTSGPTLQAILLTAAMRERGYDTLFVGGATRNPKDNMSYIAQEYGVDPIILPELHWTTNPLRLLWALIALVRLLRQLQPDIVHTHTTTAGFVGRLAARLIGVPVIVHTMHVHPFRGYYNRLTTLAFITVERIGALVSDSLITLSSHLRQELTEHYHITSKNRVSILPLGFDLSAFATTARQQGLFRTDWDIPPNAPLVGIVGRLFPVKNHKLFLEAAELVRKQIPTARFVIIGDGYMRVELETKARKLGLPVIFTGWQQHIAPIYSDLDVLVNSSWNEGTPVPIIEALAAACPVVATDVGGIPDVLNGGELGALVPAGNATALAEAIIRVLKNPPDMQHAQATMLRRYGIERLADDLDSLYRGLLAKKRG